VQHLTYFDSIILGIVEGLTEYLPVSSTGHLTITEKLLGLTVDDKSVTAYTAIIQVGAIAATVLYFFKDIVRLLGAWFRGLRSADQRTHHDYQLAWAVIVGSIPADARPVQSEEQRRSARPGSRLQRHVRPREDHVHADRPRRRAGPR